VAITGPGGHAILLLPDGTTFTLSQNCEVELDDFIYDTKTGVQKMSAKLMKGGFRWVTGKVRPRAEPTIVLPVGNIGIRGTDFECLVDADKKGHVKLYSGELELTDKTNGSILRLTAGQILTFTESTLSAPTRFLPEV
jgi:hypothetical protein